MSTMTSVRANGVELGVETFGRDDDPLVLLAGGVGGMVAQVAALDHPRAFSALTLVSTRPVAPGPIDPRPAAGAPERSAAELLWTRVADPSGPGRRTRSWPVERGGAGIA
jgi:pimeloyl-ACP methyl ester carboxylesterase